MKPSLRFPTRIIPGAALLALLLAALLALGAAAQGQDPPRPVESVSADEVNAVAKQLYCPVCENIPLDVCPTQACSQWRDLIRQKLAEGQSSAQIIDYFVAQYGDRVRAVPPPTGLNWLVYIIPPVAILAGAFVLYRAFRAWTKPAVQPAPDEPAAPGDEYIARLEEELKKR